MAAGVGVAHGVRMSVEQSSRDSWDLARELDEIQKRLADLDREQQVALVAARDAAYNKLVADTRVRGVHAEIDVLKSRGMHLMAMLRALPK